jgi:hypothetical protein
MKSSIKSNVKQITFLRGVVVALLLSFSAAVLYAALIPVFTGATVLRVLISLLTLTYAAWLLAASGIRIGRVILLAVLIGAMVCTAVWSPSLAIYALIHVGLIWLVRCCYYHTGLITAAADLGLGVLGFAAAVLAAQQSHSIFLSMWCFLLVQAVIIPLLRGGSRPQPGAAAQQDRFRRAFRSAEAALQRLSQN